MALLFVTWGGPCAAGAEPVMSKSDVGRPEPVLFLQLATKAMADYHTAHGTYPGEWWQLNMTFRNGPYRSTDPDIRPTKEHGNCWRPKDCTFSYRIVQADQDGFLIEAVNEQGVAEYAMRPGWETPRRLVERPEDRLCQRERPRGKIIPEAAMFLNAAAEAFAAYRRAHDAYPGSWDVLDFHWALTPHEATDPAARPPQDCGRRWNPQGASYTYEIVRSDPHGYEIRSTNNQNLQDYRIARGDSSPTPVSTR
jgi:hypothetical protein